MSFLPDGVSFDHEIRALANRWGGDSDAISRLIAYFSTLERGSPSESFRVLMEMNVLSLTKANFLAHSDASHIRLERFPELPDLCVHHGVWSPEFASDSYHWAKHIAARGLVDGKSVLEMGAGSGIISFLLRRLARPSFICAADVSAFAVENLRTNANAFGVPKDEFLAVRSNLFSSIPRNLRFHVALWAMPWILRDDPAIARIVHGAKDPVEKALLESVIDQGGRTVCKFISDAKDFLLPGGKILLMSTSFIQNGVIRQHAASQGFDVKEHVFAEDILVVEDPEMRLDLIHIELTWI